MEVTAPFLIPLIESVPFVQYSNEDYDRIGLAITPTASRYRKVALLLKYFDRFFAIPVVIFIETKPVS